MLFAASFSVSPGMHRTEAMKAIGVEPTFKYEALAAIGPDDTMPRMKFNVYGWDRDTAWYGMQLTNDTVIEFHRFFHKSDYKEYITNPYKK